MGRGLRKNVSLKESSFYKTGGSCDELYLPLTIDNLREIIINICHRGQPFFVLGEGSNSLISDDHWPGAVISLKHLSKISLDGEEVSAEAGASNSELAAFCLKQGLTGAEWLHRLPGQIGATTRMNARCYGGEMEKIAVSALALDHLGQEKKYSAQEIFQGYKKTIFMQNQEIVFKTFFRFSPGKKNEIKKVMTDIEEDRKQNGHFLFPSCGCVFKNNYSLGIPSGVLLEKAGAKQMKFGKAEVSPYHANFIFNKGATSSDILRLSFQMRDAVYAMFGVWLEYEMEILGSFSPEMTKQFHEKKPPKLKQAARESLKKK